jgi:aspartyl-tRNA(Asn)/glutamyl-tRNA(Gln) amidotransferase subunit A
VTDQLSARTATELLAAYADGTLSPVEVTEDALRRIEDADKRVNAFCLVDGDAALEQARRSEERWRRSEPLGLIDGVPVSIKDLLLARGWVTRRGSLSTRDARPDTEDAPTVARMREHGAVFLGKTTTPEFGWKAVTDNPLTGVTGNPYDPGRTAGGSSGGSAAAVALGMGALSVGTDGGGSIRVPASFCGIVGLKPTYGRVPIYPASPFGTLSHAGPMTRSVDDAALLLDVLAGFDPRDWSALPPPPASFRRDLAGGVRGLRIAVTTTLGSGGSAGRVDAEVAEAVHRAAERFAALGAQVEEADPGFADPLDAFHALWFAGAAKVVEKLGPEQREQLDPGLREVCAQGATVSAADYLDAVATRMALGDRMGRWHLEHDLLLTPTVPIPAFEAGREVPEGWPTPRWTAWTPYTYPFNMTQQPAVSLPAGTTADGLPIGIQLVGARHADALVLRAAKAFEDAECSGTP